MATTFPSSIQTFPTMQDMGAADGALVKQYQAAMQAGDIPTAQTILSQITNGQNKIITADLLNTIIDTNVALQNYYAQRYSPAYVVSEEQPANQEATDFWFQITSTAVSG